MAGQNKLENYYAIKSYKTRYLLSNSDKQGGRGFFLCPHGQGIGPFSL